MKDYLDFQMTGEIDIDVKLYFSKFDSLVTYQHTMDVVNELFYIEKFYGNAEAGSLTACYCHDLGRVVQNDEILDFCSQNNIVITDEEKILPSILHQKISCFIAEKVFKITDKTIINAIRYHTTLRKKPSMTEIEVFLADKMSWKEDGYKEVAQNIKVNLVESKEKAVYYYLCDLSNKRNMLKVYHSDSKEAFEYFYDEFVSRH